METAMHRQLKEQFGPDRGGRTEVSVRGFRIDAIDGDGELVEIQSGSVGPLRPKLMRLLDFHQVRLVKPVVVSRRIVRKACADGQDLSARASPKRGRMFDVFDDLVGFGTVFPHQNLVVEVVTVAVDEVRIPRRRRRGFKTLDRRLTRVFESVLLREPADLWKLLPEPPLGPFTTLDLRELTGGSIDFAQKIAYVLRQAGAIHPVGKQRNRLVYEAAALTSA